MTIAQNHPGYYTICLRFIVHVAHLDSRHVYYYFFVVFPDAYFLHFCASKYTLQIAIAKLQTGQNPDFSFNFHPFIRSAKEENTVI